MESLVASEETADWFENCLTSDRKQPDVTEYNDRTSSEVDVRELSEIEEIQLQKPRKASKPHSTPLTLKWLEENYEIADGVCIPRSTLYVHYLDYCEKNDTQPVNAASFGKIIRQQFPQITTRRLGTRGQSKYHYYGIGVREQSAYYEVIYSAKGVQSTVDGKKENSKQIIAYSPRSKLGTLLPDFPEIKDIKLPPNVAEEKVLTFLMMYRTHCQRILDTVIRANFDEVQSFLLHFWQGMPEHITSILESKEIVTLVGVCDSILYRAIASVLMPTVLQALPDSLTQVIRRFAKQLDDWLHLALDSLPENLQKIKFDLARRFSQVLKRQTSLNHLCQAARTVIHNGDITSQMLDDWLNVDLNSIVKQTLYTMDNYSDREHRVIVSLSQEFERLLEDQAPIESYIEWLDNMVEQCVVKPGLKQSGAMRKSARQFLLMWSCFGTRVIRDMTLHSAPSFGSFHLLHLMFDDYVLYLVENLHSEERSKEFLRAVKGEENIDLIDDMVLPDPSNIKDSFSTDTAHADCSSSGRQIDRSSVITSARDLVVQATGANDLLHEEDFIAHTGRNLPTDGANSRPGADTYQQQICSVSTPVGSGEFSSFQPYSSFGQQSFPLQQNRQQLLNNNYTTPYTVSGCQDQTAYYNSSTDRIPALHPGQVYDWTPRSLPVSSSQNAPQHKSLEDSGLPTLRFHGFDGAPYSLFDVNPRDISGQFPINNNQQNGDYNLYHITDNVQKRTAEGLEIGKRKGDFDSGRPFKQQMGDIYMCNLGNSVT